MTTLVIADDQAMVRDGLRLIMELSGIEVLAEAADGEEAVARVLEHAPDVVLMDVRMPRVDGIEATQRIVAAGSETRVLVLTTFDLDKHVYDAMTAGASGFVLKDATGPELVTAVERTAAGEVAMAPAVMERLIGRFLERPPAEEAPPEVLSARELEVLALIGRGLSNAEIAQELFVSMATVKTHVRHILAKLGLRDRVQAVVLAHRLGLV